jgi:quercetin dioxygenase-like cupin family protein
MSCFSQQQPPAPRKQEPVRHYASAKIAFVKVIKLTFHFDRRHFKACVLLGTSHLRVCLMPGTLVAQAAKVTPLFSKDLTNLPGKEGLMVTVEYSPGSSDPIHRHNAYGFIYVLEGSIVMRVRGGKEMTLTPGQTFYEGPDEIHVVGRNASQTKPAKFVVFFVKDKGAPVLVPAN